jgi:hypothetical protein
MNPSSWVQETCQRVGRNFTYAEWRQYYPDEAYRKTCEELPKHMSYYRGIAEQTLSDSDDSWRIQNALDRVRMEMEKDNSFAEDSAGESLNIVEELISEKIFTDMRYRNWQEALDLLGQAKAYDSLFVSTMKKIKDPDSLNSLCWDGSVNGFAEQVIEYCERAVAFNASDPVIRDSRGLARALTGDYAGAIDDFQFFVDHGADRGLNESLIQQRRGWIADLKAGINPFTPDVLEELKGQ